jgi:hypothetical protein
MRKRERQMRSRGERRDEKERETDEIERRDEKERETGDREERGEMRKREREILEQ